jgi:hypothetical protein
MIGMWTNCWSRLPLADMEVFRSMGSRFNPKRVRLDGSDLAIWICIIAGVTLVVFVLSKLLSRQERIRRYSSPRGLFRELCKAHGLDRAERRLLMRLANHHQLEHPARMFLEDERFGLESLSGELRGQGSEIVRLHDRLFAEPTTEAIGTADAPVEPELLAAGAGPEHS